MKRIETQQMMRKLDPNNARDYLDWGSVRLQSSLCLMELMSNSAPSLP
ncbi:hypothetical protein ACFLWB_01615 [Chloroflexota bacterium]